MWYKVGINVLLLPSKRKINMITFTGDYSCRLDEKGRLLLPAAFIRQMAAVMQENLFEEGYFEACLVLYPMNEWEGQNQILRQNTNPYNRNTISFFADFSKAQRK